MVDGMSLVEGLLQSGLFFGERLCFCSKNRLQLNVLYSFIHIFCLLVKYLLLLVDY